MFKYSIVFSARNREEQLRYAFPTILEKYKNRDDVEIVCMDDDSDDNTRNILDNFLNYSEYSDSWKKRFSIYGSLRDRTEGYDIKQNRQINFLVDKTDGEYLILQSAEVAYIDDIIEDLSVFASDKHVAFAHVLNCEKPSVNDDFLKLLSVDRKKFVWDLFSPGFTVRVNHVTCDMSTFAPALSGVILLDLNSHEKRNHMYFHPEYILKLPDKDRFYQEYSGPLRLAPLFFCGMIRKSDFTNMGGYPDADLVDATFANILSKNNFKFTFTSSLAVHIKHDKN